VAAILLLVGGVSTLVFGVLENFYEFAGFCPTTCNFVDGVTYIGNNANLFYTADVFLTLAVLAFVPGVLALFVSLRKDNAGLSMLGASFAAIGSGIVLAYVPDLFYLVQEAQIYVTGTGASTVLNLNPLNATAGLGIVYTANDIGFFAILVGILILGIVMAAGSSFGRIPGILGILAALVGIVGTSIYPTGGGTTAEAVSMLTYVLLLFWAAASSYKMMELPS
jgi:hypothetical protein